MRRLVNEIRKPEGEQQVRLPWGSRISYLPTETIGQAIARRGIYDYAVCEVLLRLADPGEMALDVGANIGHMTSALSHAVGERGKVIAFEPHPVVFERLQRNAGLNVELHQVALSSENGTAILSNDFHEANQGSASIARSDSGDRHEVATARLDSLVTKDVGVMKLDVEGHELEVLAGAEGLLGRIRDIVFEEHGQPPTEVTRLLERRGYMILQFEERLFGLSVNQVNATWERRDNPDLLATLNPTRAIERLSRRGSRVYYGTRRSSRI